MHLQALCMGKKTFPLKENQTIPPNKYLFSKQKNNEEIAEIYSNYYKIKFVGWVFTIYGEWEDQIC